ncbi:Fur-regulated basic protein FbpA [Salinibacillus aidingensis]|uniref:Fur-regulated basic protein FbpA n=1 Tax=Salinibacillus aidingensis TaxID=237684 RepID=UPI0031D07AB2
MEERRQYLIYELWKHGYETTPEPDGIETKDLTLTELEQIHINVKCKIGKEMRKRESKKV